MSTDLLWVQLESLFQKDYMSPKASGISQRPFRTYRLYPAIGEAESIFPVETLSNLLRSPLSVQK